MDYEWIDSSCVHPTNVHTETPDTNGVIVVAANPHRIALHISFDSNGAPVTIFVDGDPLGTAGPFLATSSILFHWFYHGDLLKKQFTILSTGGGVVAIVEMLKAPHEKTV